MSTFDLKFENLDKWEAWLSKCQGEDLDRMKTRIVKSMGLETLNQVDNYTPRQSGRLQNSMQFGAKENYFKMQVGRLSYVTVGTTVPYAKYVEEGFSQTKGRFVPGFWSGGTFHYVPDYEGGMVLTGKIIPGAHMFKKALDSVGDDYAKIVEFEFRRLYAELMG